MRNSLRKLFAPILNRFENSEGAYHYKASHRTILIAIGVLFLALSIGALYFSVKTSSFGGVLPLLVFFTVGSVCEIVGLLGSDRAVANIWKSK